MTVRIFVKVPLEYVHGMYACIPEGGNPGYKTFSAAAWPTAYQYHKIIDSSAEIAEGNQLLTIITLN